MPSDRKDNGGKYESAELENVVRAEEEFLHQRLREELGREPTSEELDAWLRQHTEAY